MFSFFCTPLVYYLGALCSFFIYILLFPDQKKKKKKTWDLVFETANLPEQGIELSERK